MGSALVASEPSAADIEFFEKKVRPVLATRCYKCHGPTKQEAGLRVDSRAALLEGGDSGPAIVPGKPAEGLLVDAINYGELYQMPKDGKLKPDEIAAITEWVKRGAPWPSEAAVAAGAKYEFNLQERAKHWAYQPIGAHRPPELKQTARPRGDIDRFLLARLEAAGLAPAPNADRRTWIRRVYFAVIGLPPAPDEVEAFVEDKTSDAHERVVDRLLQSPHFGERWARHWLDLVRYAESRGHEFDYDVPNAWQYRDYVIRAFNADVPYDKFVIEHIAGDLLEEPRRHPQDGFNESILGTGFWFLGEWVHSPVDVRKDEADRFDNMIDVMTKTFLGLTVACARCHDHKFDAITQKDFYALQGYLQSSTYRQVCFDTLEHNRRIAERLHALRREHQPRLMQALVASRRPAIDKFTDYLLAAREALLPGAQWSKDSESKKSQRGVKELKPEYREQVAAFADKRGLNNEILIQLVVHLVHARNDITHPLHAWSLLTTASDSDEPGKVAAVLQPLLERWQRQRTAAAAAIRKATVVIDYSNGAEGDFFQDGVAFGSGPVPPGEAIFGDDPSQPIVEIASYGSVRRDKALSCLRLARGTQEDAGRMGGVLRSGQTFRTPNFTIETGQVFYLVQGAGRAYAAVDSHLLNHGPLHAEFAHQWPDDGGKPRWVAHNLKLYKGHRAHLEFTPVGDADLQVLMVVQAHSQPGNPLERPNELISRLFAPHDAMTARSIAAAYAKMLAEIAEKLARGKNRLSPDEASLANWLVQGTWLTASREQPALPSAVTAFVREQQRLIEQFRREPRTAPAMWDGPGEDERLFIRGNHKTLGEVVPRRFLEVLSVTPPNPQSAIRNPQSSGSGRLDLAKRMTDPSRNPLISRVIVNRVWHHFFGRGIVESVDNFGLLGKPPTHRELLDYLATRFVQEGWSIKRLIRSITLSSAYRMSSEKDGRAEQVDPDNLLLHRMPLRRLEAEAIRDSILAVSGRLDRTQFGSPVPVYLTPFMQGRGRPSQSGPLDGAGRRSVYIAVRRNFLSPMMLAYDVPIPFTTMGRRNVSNVPAQALILMNDPFVLQQAGVWGKRVRSEPDRTPQERIHSMYLAAFARPPTQQELTDALAFLESQAKERRLPRDQAFSDPVLWSDLAHVLFNVKEFIFVR
jgi:hypothetical protein